MQSLRHYMDIVEGLNEAVWPFGRKKQAPAAPAPAPAASQPAPSTGRATTKQSADDESLFTRIQQYLLDTPPQGDPIKHFQTLGEIMQRCGSTPLGEKVAAFVMKCSGSFQVPQSVKHAAAMISGSTARVPPKVMQNVGSMLEYAVSNSRNPDHDARDVIVRIATSLKAEPCAASLTKYLDGIIGIRWQDWDNRIKWVLDACVYIQKVLGAMPQDLRPSR